jgi:hypothetical protein
LDGGDSIFTVESVNVFWKVSAVSKRVFATGAADVLSVSEGLCGSISGALSILADTEIVLVC